MPSMLHRGLEGHIGVLERLEAYIQGLLVGLSF